MAGVAGALIGLLANSQTPIGGMTQAVADGTDSGRGCTTNFIGFGKDLTSTTQSADGVPIEDFNATDDTVTEANSLAQSFAPTYTGDVLSWVDTTP